MACSSSGALASGSPSEGWPVPAGSVMGKGPWSVAVSVFCGGSIGSWDPTDPVGDSIDIAGRDVLLAEVAQ
eukprot:3761810-Rhodomonas_salina.1